MLDHRLVAAGPELVKDHLRRRHAAPELLDEVDEVARLASRRSELIGERDGLRGERNTLSKQIGGLYREGKRAEAEALKARVQAGSQRTAAIEAELAEVQARQDAILMTLPNLLDGVVPTGKTDEDNELVRTWGTPRSLDFEPQPHVELGEALGILDFERAAKMSGARFWVLSGAGARLERALINFFLDMHTQQHGYTEVMVPYIVQRHAMEGTGQLPKFEEDLFKLAGKLNGEDAYLVPTAEVPVTNLHRDEILDVSELPRKYAAFTPCFRSEAGSAGRDTRGLMRVHQFHKVELVWITADDASDDAHQALLGHAESILQALELPYRVMLLSSGDTSFSAARCYDLEVWIPSQDKYREVSSVSNFRDFQARRMALRFRPEPPAGKKKSKARLAHTLNGSGLAVGRTLIAILENYQQADGSVVIPAVLRPYMGGLEVLRPVGA